MNPRSMIGVVFVAGILAVGAGPAGRMLDAADAKPEGQRMRQRAEAAFKEQSYNLAIRHAEEFLATDPPVDQARAMRRIVGISQVALRQYPAGIKTLQDLIKGDKQFERDIAMLQSLASALVATNRAQPNEVMGLFEKAIATAATDGKKTKRIELLFELAAYQTRHVNRIRPIPKTRDQRLNLLSGIALTLATYDRILELGGSEADQIRALASEANLMRRHGRVLDDVPRPEWPASIVTEYDLTKPYALAITFERAIVRRFPDDLAARTALLRIGETQSNNLSDYLAAVVTYGELVSRYARSTEAKKAQELIDGIRAPALSFRVEGVTLPGKRPTYSWTSRNIKTIECKAYAIDLASALRDVDGLHELGDDSLDGLQPVTEWRIETGDRSDHQPRSSGETPAEAPVTESNAYLVVATGANPDDRIARERMLLIVSRLGLLTKTSDSKSALFAVDALTGKPILDTRAFVRRWVGRKRVDKNRQKNVYEWTERAVPDNGLAIVDFDRRADRQGGFEQFQIVRHGADYALCAPGAPYFGWWRQSLDGYYIYSYADRPVYRPLQTVHFKHLVRDYADGGYRNRSGLKVDVKIYDSRNNAVYEKQHGADEFGAIEGSFTLGESPALGMYRMQLAIPKNQPARPKGAAGILPVPPGGQIHTSPGVAFRVEEYKKPEFEVTVKAEQPTYRVGANVKVAIHGEYYFGGPVAGADVEYTVQKRTHDFIPYWRGRFDWLYDGADAMGHRFAPRGARTDLVQRGTLKTDEFGNATVEFRAEPFEQTPHVDLDYVIEAKMVDESRREINGSRTIKVSHHAFAISLRPQRSLYQPGDRVRVEVKAENPNGQPVAFQGKALISYVLQREERDKAGKVKQQEKLEAVSERAFAVDADGRNDLVFEAERKGYYRIEITAPDPYGETVTGTAYLWIAEGKGEFAHLANRDLELVLDTETVTAGDTLRALLNSKHEDAYVLLTAEADEVYLSKVVYVEGNSTTVDIPIEASFRPNVTLTASLFRDNQIFRDERALRVPPVEQFLTVKIKAPKQEFQPRESAEIEVEVTDHQGNPAATDLSLGIVDASIFYIQSETRGDIRKFFFGRERPRLVETTSSYAFPWYGSIDLIQRSVRADSWAEESALPMSAPMDAARGTRAMAKGAGKQAEPAFQEAQVRTEFPDTVYWAANLRTGTDGKATATIRFPDSLTTWRLTAIAATKETAVGEVKHEVRTKKNVIVRLQAPRFFVEKDQVTLSAIAHNYLDQPKTVRVAMTTTAELLLTAVGVDGEFSTAAGGAKSDEGWMLDVTVPPGGEKRVDFQATAMRPGTVKILAKALTDTESDALEKEYPVLEYGSEKLLAESGILFGKQGSEDSVSVRMRIPELIRGGSQRLTVQVSPTIAGVMLESLPYLLDYPYGCTEQTMSRFVPAVLTANTLRKLGIDLAEVRKIAGADPTVAKRLARMSKSPVYDSKEMRKIIKAGLDRLADFQQSDGGWGWWKSDASNPYISAYVVSGLTLASESGVSLPENMLPRGVQFLAAQVVRDEPVTRYRWQREEDVSVRVYMLYALANADRAKLAEPKIKQRLDDAFRKRDALNDYSRALLALALQTGGLNERAGITLANIKDRADVDEKSGTVSWGDYSGYHYWYQSGTEATSYSLMALLAIKPTSPMVPQTVDWLLRHRRGTRWFNTKDTATVCHALADYLQLTGELDPDLTITVDVDGRTSKRFRVNRQNLFTFDNELSLTGAELGTGEKLVTVRRSGRGNLYWGAYTTFFTKEEKIAAAGNELFVQREYQRLIPREVEKTRSVFDRARRKTITEKYRTIEYDRKPLTEGDSLASGDLIEVSLKVEARNNFEYLVFEDPKPAGCETTEVKSGYAWEGGLGGHREFRDEKVAFFATYLNQGKHELRYRLRAETPGVFHALPAHAECMYAPRVTGNSDSRIIRIVEK